MTRTRGERIRAFRASSVYTSGKKENKKKTPSLLAVSRPNACTKQRLRYHRFFCPCRPIPFPHTSRITYRKQCPGHEEASHALAYACTISGDLQPEGWLIARGGIGCRRRPGSIRSIQILLPHSTHVSRSRLISYHSLRTRSTHLLTHLHLATTTNVSFNEFLGDDSESKSMNAALSVNKVHRCAVGRTGGLGEPSLNERRGILQDEL